MSELEKKQIDSIKKTFVETRKSEFINSVVSDLESRKDSQGKDIDAQNIAQSQKFVSSFANVFFDGIGDHLFVLRKEQEILLSDIQALLSVSKNSFKQIENINNEIQRQETIAKNQNVIEEFFVGVVEDTIDFTINTIDMQLQFTKELMTGKLKTPSAILSSYGNKLGKNIGELGMDLKDTLVDTSMVATYDICDNASDVKNGLETINNISSGIDDFILNMCDDDIRQVTNQVKNLVGMGLDFGINSITSTSGGSASTNNDFSMNDLLDEFKKENITNMDQMSKSFFESLSDREKKQLSEEFIRGIQNGDDVETLMNKMGIKVRKKIENFFVKKSEELLNKSKKIVISKGIDTIQKVIAPEVSAFLMANPTVIVVMAITVTVLSFYDGFCVSATAHIQNEVLKDGPKNYLTSNDKNHYEKIVDLENQKSKELNKLEKTQAQILNQAAETLFKQNDIEKYILISKTLLECTIWLKVISNNFKYLSKADVVYAFFVRVGNDLLNKLSQVVSSDMYKCFLVLFFEYVEKDLNHTQMDCPYVEPKTMEVIQNVYGLNERTYCQKMSISDLNDFIYNYNTTILLDWGKDAGQTNLKDFREQIKKNKEDENIFSKTYMEYNEKNPFVNPFLNFPLEFIVGQDRLFSILGKVVVGSVLCVGIYGLVRGNFDFLKFNKDNKDKNTKKHTKELRKRI